MTASSVSRLAAAGLLSLALGTAFVGGRATITAAGPATPAAASPRADLVALPVTAPSYSAVVDRVAPAVVTLRVQRRVEGSRTALPAPLREFFGQDFGENLRPRREGGLGSGVFVREDGYLLTNHHVVAGADRIQVELADGRSFPGTLVGSDPASDLAVVRIDARGLPTVGYGDSNAVKVGDVVLAFGNPLGVGQTVTMGIVSAKGRATGVGDGSYEDFLQTDAPINQGNSGGALVDTQGRLVGINAQIVSPSGGNIGLGFAIPSAMAQAVADQLIRDGVVRRAKLGVIAQPLTPDLATSLGLPDAHGALVSRVEDGSPAAKAGVRQGDVITTIDGKPVADANALRNSVASLRPGSETTIVVMREGQRRELTARVVEREAERSARPAPRAGEEREDPAVGMTVTPVTPELARELRVERADGIAVMEVDPDGAAAAAGLRPGDVIIRVNGRTVDSVAALRSALDASGGRPALVLVARQGESVFVALSRDRA
ncbi:MAG: Do family serine endopeptidase [Vicinamibacterales bacterium]